uniref:RFX-type winged-helix domain-containing protein n=2 Tax=Timema TaxID=61471 RepID=A0A7R9G1K5_TIMSH|nr:unnamed protein product [Timema shepardi]
MVSLVLTDSSQLTSDSQHIASNLDLPVIVSLVYCESIALDHAVNEAGLSGKDQIWACNEGKGRKGEGGIVEKELPRKFVRAAVLVARGIEPTTVKSFVNIECSRVQTSVKTATPSLPPYLQNSLSKHGVCIPEYPLKISNLHKIANFQATLERDTPLPSATPLSVKYITLTLAPQHVVVSDVTRQNLRTYNGMSADLYKASDYDRLALSLTSPLPNEQDFAINVCTLLSNEGKHTLRLDKCPRLIDFLLAHAGVYNHSSMREYFEYLYGSVRNHSTRQFWEDVLEDPNLIELIDESRFVIKKKVKVAEVLVGNDKDKLKGLDKEKEKEIKLADRGNISLENTGAISEVVLKTIDEKVKKLVVDKVEKSTDEKVNKSLENKVEKSDIANVEKSNVVNLKKSDVDNLKKSNVANLEKSDVAKVEKSHIANLEKSDLANVEKSNVANLEKSDIANIDKSNFVNLEKSNVANFEKSDVANLDKSDIANLGKSEIAKLDKSDNANSEKSDHVNLEKLGNSNLKNSEGAKFENSNNVKLNKCEDAEVGKLADTLVMSDNAKVKKLDNVEVEKLDSKITKSGDIKTENSEKVEVRELEKRCKEEPEKMEVDLEINEIVKVSEEHLTCEPMEICEEILNEEIVYEEGEDGLMCEVKKNKKNITKKHSEERAKICLKLEPCDKELFCLGRTYGTQDYVGQRVLQIVTILRNLSFVEENMNVLASNVTFVRFVLLCARARWNNLHQAGLDMLGNISLDMRVEDPSTHRLSGVLVSVLTIGVGAEDRFVVLSCLEVLNKLSQREENEDIMLRCLDQRVYETVCQYLTLHDIMLLIYTLECLYNLSSLGERACNYITRVHGAIDTLVSLITVEAQSYGPKACILMRVVETVSGSNAGSSTTTTTTSAAMASGTPTPAPPISTCLPGRSNAPARHSTTPQKMVIGAPQPAVATPVSLTQTQIQQQHAHTQQQQQHAHQQAVQENEQFTLSWLRATFEPVVGARIEQGEMYKQYLTACSKIGRRGVIAPLHFPRCVRSVFGGSVGPTTQKASNLTAGTTEPPPCFYEGIKVRPNPFPLGVSTGVQPPAATPRKLPLPFQKHVSVSIPPVRAVTPPPAPPPVVSPPPAKPRAPTPVPVLPPVLETTVVDTSLPMVPAPSSPILKAQLSAPPKPRETSTKGDVKSQVLAHPHLTQALLGSTGAQPQAKEGCSTSLIKSLLATKVTPCMSPPALTGIVSMPATSNTASDSSQQVTQRQQQQQRLLQQQLNSQSTSTDSSSAPATPAQANKSKPITSLPLKLAEQRRTARMNGARTSVAVQSQVAPVKEFSTESNTNSNSSTESTPIVGATSISTITPRIVENHATAAGGNCTLRGRREPPQPPPPPLAPLNSGTKLPLAPRFDPEDSDSTGNNSLASSSRDCSGLGASNVSSTDDGENSLTSFEGFLLNGIPNSIDIDAASNDSSSKDSVRSGVIIKPGCKSLMLADLLEKRVDKKEPPILNGIVGKELRIGDKGLELVENHLEKVLKESVNLNVTVETKTGELIETTTEQVLKEMSSDEGLVRIMGEVMANKSSVLVKTDKDSDSAAFKTVGTVTDDNVMDSIKYATTQTQTQGLKRPADTAIGATVAKRPHLVESSVLNGTSSPIPVISIKEESTRLKEQEVVIIKEDISTVRLENTTESDSSTERVSASSSAANLYAALAASALEDEPELELETIPHTVGGLQIAGRQTMFLGQGVDSSGQQLIMTAAAAPRQIIVSQGQLASQGQVLISAGGQITLQQGGPTAAIKAAGGHQGVPVLVQTGGGSSQRTQLAAVAQQGAQLVQAGQVVLTQSSTGQFILSQTPPSQVQLVTGGTQGGQYIMSTGGTTGQTHYVVAQPQTALVQGQTQTVLVAQTPQQQGTTAKTIIILQPQGSGQTTQKVMMTSQGQQVVVTQVPRPIMQGTPSGIPPPALVPTSNSANNAVSSSLQVHQQTQVQHIQPHPQQQLAVQQKPLQQASLNQQQQFHHPQQQSSLPTTKLVANASSNTPPLKCQSPQPVNQSSVTRPAVPSPTVSSVIQHHQPTRPINPTSPSFTGTPTKPFRPLLTQATLRPAHPQPPVPVRQPTPSTVQRPSIKTYQNTRMVVDDKSAATQTRNVRPAVIVGQSTTTAQTRTNNPLDQAMFLCEWRGCMRSFKSANEVYLHACEAHCPLGSEEIQCLWERCDAMRRKRFSLMTHLYDRHCNADVLRMMAVRRKQLSQSGRSEIPPPQPPPPHPGYAPNAAFHAIKRHALEFVNPKELMKTAPASVQTRTGASPPEQSNTNIPTNKTVSKMAILWSGTTLSRPGARMRSATFNKLEVQEAVVQSENIKLDDNEGPVTKSIRLTSSLILRNLVIYSTNGRRFLRSYEPHLASVALSNVESSRTIAQVLYDMNQQMSSQRSGVNLFLISLRQAALEQVQDNLAPRLKHRQRCNRSGATLFLYTPEIFGAVGQ